MDKLLIVAKREYLERIRSRWFIVMTLLVPAIMVAAIMIPAYIASHGTASTGVRHIRILDASGAGLGQQISAALMADSSLNSPGSDSIVPRVDVIAASDVAARERDATEEARLPKHIIGYLTVTDSTLAGHTAHYAGRNASAAGDMEKLTTIVRQTVMIARLQHEGVRADIVNDLATGSLRISSDRITDNGRGGSGEAGLIAGFVVGILLFMSITIHGQNVLRGVLEEKTTRVAEVVLSSIKPESLLAGKVLGVGAVGLTQQVAWLAIGGYLTAQVLPLVTKGAAHAAAGAAGAAPPTLGAALGSFSFGMLGVALAYFLIGFVFYASLYAAAGSMVNSEQEAQQAQGPILVLLLSTWLLVQVVWLNPNGKVAAILSWLPWSSPIVMPMRMGLTTVSPFAVAGSILVAILGCVGAVWLSARIYRVGMLMYGKKPTFGELAKWIRYA